MSAGSGPAGSRTIRRSVEQSWQDFADPLKELVHIPSVSPSFDPDWRRNGHIEDVVDTAATWLRGALPSETVVEVLRLANRTPILLCDTGRADGSASGERDATVVFYGHLDVQPAGDGWTVTDPFTPVIAGDFLYGRGSSDDKYSPFVYVALVDALRHAGVAVPRLILLLETSEESSSTDFPDYLDAYSDLLGEPLAFVCLDAFVPSNDRLWITTSMRGIIVADLTVAVGRIGLHSGLVGGVVPSSFRILRQLLDRIEDSRTGEVLSAALAAEIPVSGLPTVANQAGVGAKPSQLFATLPGVEPDVPDAGQQVTRLGWRAAIAYVGIAGMPGLDDAGSVLRPSTTVRLSIRTPPTVDALAAATQLGDELTSAPPQGVQIQFDVQAAQSGWHTAPDTRLASLFDEASGIGYSNQSMCCVGSATLPVLEMLSLRFPMVPILPVGVVTAASNPHGPDECLDFAAAVRLSDALTHFVIGLGVQYPELGTQANDPLGT